MSQTPPDSPPSPSKWYGNRPIYCDIALLVISTNLSQIYDDFDNFDNFDNFDITLDNPPQSIHITHKS